MRENKSLYALLGILSLGPHTGYDIKRRIERSLGHFWQESYGQIYPNLKKLVDEGWATLHTETNVGRPRNVYSITDNGQKVLHAWLENPIDNLPPEKNEMLLKLYFGQNRPVEANIRLIKEYQAKMEEVMQQFQMIQSIVKKSPRPQPDYGMMTLSFGQHVVEAIVEWCQLQTADLQKWKRNSEMN